MRIMVIYLTISSKTKLHDYEIVIVDNDSNDLTLKFVNFLR